MRALALVSFAILSMLVVAGCVSPSAENEVDPASAAPAAPGHVLAGALEPAAFDLPTFELLGAITAGGPVYGVGEPSIWAHTDGTVYAAFPGCDDGPYYLLPTLPTQRTCAHGTVFRSDDAGATWTRLNRESDGRLTDDGPAANGDADVAVDAAGTVYTSNLGGGGIQVHASDDRGDTWRYLANVVPEDHWADRQWMAAAAPGHLVMAWMGGKDAQRAVAVNTTFDGGENWTGTTYLGESIGWLGTVQFSTDGQQLFLPFTQGTGSAGTAGTAREFTMFVARSLDGGLAWDVVDTGARIVTNAQGQHWSGVNMAPAFDITGDGTLVVAWSEDVNAPADLTALGSVVKVATSTDAGETWTAPRDVSTTRNAIMPWVTGGAGDRFAVTYFASALTGDPDYVGQWSLRAVVVDGDEAHDVLIDPNVHEGGICSRGGGCRTSGSDRALLDFFEADLLPDGRLVVIYPADPAVQSNKEIEIRIAVQNGGTPLLQQPESA